MTPSHTAIIEKTDRNGSSDLIWCLHALVWIGSTLTRGRISAVERWRGSLREMLESSRADRRDRRI